ncbi:hypothetical protein KKH96_00715 [Patescibacteria group bacterium]|nr:hypothetical protein [Patescibacteria group bacterium]
MHRNVTRRNLLGGFLGGVSGILFFGYLHPAFLPLGVIMGVVVGWWYKDILRVFIVSLQKGIQFGKKSYNFLVESATKPSIIFKKMSSRAHLFIEIRMCLAVLSAIWIVFIWVAYRPIALIRWPFAHPMNRTYLARVAAITTFVAITALWVSLIIIRLMPDVYGGGMNYKGEVIPFTAFGFGDLFTFTFMTSIFPIMFGLLYYAKEPGPKTFYHSFDKYNRHGFLGFYLRELFLLLRHQVLFFGYIITSLVYFIGAGTLFVGLIVIPLSTFIYAIKGIQRIVMRNGHWICLSVTMAVTIYLAVKFSPYFDNKQVLWTIAFMTGVTSGAITELVRSVLDLILHKTSRGRQYATANANAYLKYRLGPKGKIILKGWSKINELEVVKTIF